MEILLGVLNCASTHASGITVFPFYLFPPIPTLKTGFLMNPNILR